MKKKEDFDIQLRKLEKLKDDKIISREDFDRKKKILLGGDGEAGNSNQNLIRQITDYERISGILWIILGVIQICTLLGAIAGIWNIFAGRSRLRISKHISQRDSNILPVFEPIGQLIVTGIINVLIGGIIGIALVVFDFYIRKKVLSNAHVFTFGHQGHQTILSSPSVPMKIMLFFSVMVLVFLNCYLVISYLYNKEHKEAKMLTIDFFNSPYPLKKFGTHL